MNFPKKYMGFCQILQKAKRETLAFTLKSILWSYRVPAAWGDHSRTHLRE